MERCARLARVGDWGWFLAWGLLSSCWCVAAARELGATFDEPVYLVRGLECWHTGSHQGLMQLGTMPLPVDLDTFPLYLAERWRGAPFNPTTDFQTLLPWARAGTLVFWWVLLAYGRLTARELAGPWGGRLAVALIAVEPSFLAHASLATTDVAVTACLLALVYHFRTARETGWLCRVGVPALWFAAAVLAKASGLVFGPLCLATVEAERWWRARNEIPLQAGPVPSTRTWVAAFVRDVGQVVALGLVVVFLYCGSDWQPQASFLAWAHSLPDDALGRDMAWLAEHLRVFSNAGEGLVRQIKHNVRGHGVFLLGQDHPRAFWYYFPVALSIKLSVPLLVLPVLAGLVRPRALVNWATLTALVLLAFSLTCRVQIGVRLVLPLVALLAVGTAAAVVRAWQEGRRLAARQLLAAAAGIGLAWTAADAAAVWPHGLCYVNELWGGTATGYLRLSDSNYDWGQGLPELARWQGEHGIEPLDVWYFGTDPRLRTMPVREVPFHVLPDNATDPLAAVRGHYLAVSTTLLHGPEGPNELSRRVVAVLRACRPVGRTTTFWIYDFRESVEPESPGAGSQVSRSSVGLRAGPSRHPR